MVRVIDKSSALMIWDWKLFSQRQQLGRPLIKPRSDKDPPHLLQSGINYFTKYLRKNEIVEKK